MSRLVAIKEGDCQVLCFVNVVKVTPTQDEEGVFHKDLSGFRIQFRGGGYTHAVPICANVVC